MRRNDDFNASLQCARAPHTAKSPLQKSVITLCKIKIRPILPNTNKTALFIVFELSWVLA